MASCCETISPLVFSVLELIFLTCSKILVPNSSSASQISFISLDVAIFKPLSFNIVSNVLKSLGSYFRHISHIIRGKLLYASRPTNGAICEIEIVNRLAVVIFQYIYIYIFIF